jgi:predicted GTPase
MNSVLRIKRSVVTEIEGTTNEPVISNLTREKTSFNLIDTAGITKNKKLEKIV